MKEYEKGERPFNMALLFLTRLDIRQNEAQESKVSGDFFRWFRTLENIYDMIEFKIIEHDDKKENENLLNLFKKAKNQLNAMTGGNGGDIQKQIAVLSLSTSNETLREISRILNRLMYKYEFLYPQKKYTTLDQSIKNAYEK